MAFIGMISTQPAGEKSDSTFSGGLLAACFAPMAMYTLIYGQVIHFFFLFVCTVVLKLLWSLDVMGVMKNAPVATKPVDHGLRPGRHLLIRTDSSRVLSTPTPQSSRVSSVGGQRTVGTLFGSTRIPQRTVRQIAPAPIQATQIVSSDDATTKQRRGILNKISPDKLDELTCKLIETFNEYADESILKKDANDFFSLVFSAASRQPEYVSVFTELVNRISHEILTPEDAEDIILNQCQIQWSSVCLTPVEKTKGWELLIDVEDQQDARARHKSKQLAIAEFCGLLASAGLIPPSFPLTWLETLMRPVCMSSKSRIIAKASSLETAVEIVCKGVRGIGQSEAHGLLTDADAFRFKQLCDTLGSLPTNSSRVRCLIQDLIELRESGWSKIPTWKQALQPTKRLSSLS